MQVSVDTESGTQTVATFILEDEADLAETITKLKNHNPIWSPVQWTTDNLPDRVAVLRSIFPG